VLDDLGRVEESLAATAHPDDKLLTEASRHSIAAAASASGHARAAGCSVRQPKDRGSSSGGRDRLTTWPRCSTTTSWTRPWCAAGHPSANSRWNNSVAILTGDFLFARPPDPGPPGPDAVRIQAETFSRLVTGQMAETVGPRPGQDLLDFYMHVITEKTGSLIATSGQFGALFSGAPAEVADQIAAACEQIGVAWQLSDDVIDIASELVAVGQDARYRPAPGRADAAGALRAALHRWSPRPTRGCAGCWRRPT